MCVRQYGFRDGHGKHRSMSGKIAQSTMKMMMSIMFSKGGMNVSITGTNTHTWLLMMMSSHGCRCRFIIVAGVMENERFN